MLQRKQLDKAHSAPSRDQIDFVAAIQQNNIGVWRSLVCDKQRPQTKLSCIRIHRLSYRFENARPNGKRERAPKHKGTASNKGQEWSKLNIFYRGMAQFGSALDWGSRGHGFKSRYSDHKLR